LQVASTSALVRSADDDGLISFEFLVSQKPDPAPSNVFAVGFHLSSAVDDGLISYGRPDLTQHV
jgi:hypothetical protein